ncbi:hypothetical protein [Povalibacter sp.]|uniref:hypothetical protein n=1 Tax=Povalibacter sp. TaxID=1962978 RepID=UPI002F429618
MKKWLDKYLSESPRARKVCGWFIVMGRWLREGWAVWITLGVLAIVFAYLYCCDLPSDNEERARIVGTLLQLAGIGTVFEGYERTREQFGHSRAFMALWRWLKSIPWRGPKPINGFVSAQLPSVTATAVGGRIHARCEDA